MTTARFVGKLAGALLLVYEFPVAAQELSPASPPVESALPPSQSQVGQGASSGASAPVQEVPVASAKKPAARAVPDEGWGWGMDVGLGMAFPTSGEKLALRNRSDEAELEWGVPLEFEFKVSTPLSSVSFGLNVGVAFGAFNTDLWKETWTPNLGMGYLLTMGPTFDLAYRLGNGWIPYLSYSGSFARLGTVLGESQGIEADGVSATRSEEKPTVGYHAWALSGVAGLRIPIQHGYFFAEGGYRMLWWTTLNAGIGSDDVEVADVSDLESSQALMLIGFGGWVY